MIVTALTLFSLLQAPLTCAIMGGNAAPNGPAVDYQGVRYSFCCPMCPGAFQKDPSKAINADKNKGKTIGVALFDPVSGTRISTAQAKATEDYNGVRYLFLSTDEKTSFDATPTKFTAIPAKEALYCPVEKEKISGYAAAGGYRDYNGVRYYFCCAGCPADFDKKPADYAKVAAAFVTDAKALLAPAEKETKADVNKDFVAETFACKHCGRSMSINSPEDAKSTCSACRCGKTMEDCKN